MPEQLVNYQCPNCGGPLKWDAGLQKLHCASGGRSYPEAEPAAYYRTKEEAAAEAGAQAYAEEAGEWSDSAPDGMKAYHCPSCGAELIADENTAVTTCPYCNNPTVISAQFKVKQPKYVLPFQVTKEQAETRLQEFYQKKPFLPHAFSNRNHIQEVKGVYVPFWLYSGTLAADCTYHCTRTRQFSQGDYMVTETDHFKAVRRGDVSFQRVPADASSKMPDTYMDALEPFDYRKLENFSSAYMPGYLADSYDIDSRESQKRTDERMIHSTLALLNSTVAGYVSVIPERQDVYRKEGTAEYVFLPVWLLSTQFEGKNYLFAVNGQSGKTVGDLPADTGKFIRTIVILTLISFAIIALILYFLIARGGTI